MNVLVVDDTKNIRALLTKCLELEGYAVKTAEDGRSALSLIEKERFDLLFLDIKMPLLSGTEVLRRAREMGVTTPVVIVTAYATVKNAVDCTQLGAVAYLQKPFTADKIKTVLKEVLASPVVLPLTASAMPAFADVRALLEAGDFMGALAAGKAASANDPFSGELYGLLAEASGRLGKTEDAKGYRRLAAACGAQLASDA
jgi:two-component system, OmpR family, response regulator